MINVYALCSNSLLGFVVSVLLPSPLRAAGVECGCSIGRLPVALQCVMHKAAVQDL